MTRIAAQVPYARRYVAQPGDSLFAIAKYHGLSVDQLLDANPAMRSNPDALGVGQAVTVPPTSSAAASSSSSGGLSGPDRVIDHTARTEGGGRYDAWNPDDVGKGVSYGLIQFNQKAGRLPELLQRMHDADPQRFRGTFGSWSDKLLDASWVKRANFNHADLKSRMIQAGGDPVFQQVQRDVAKERYFDPVAALGAKHGLNSERALSILFDAAVQMGPERVAQMLPAAAAAGGTSRQILQRFVQKADAVRYANGRRGKLLRDPALSDAPLDGVGKRRAPTPEPLRHRVQAGDSLWSIAQRYGVDFRDLAASNGLSVSGTLHPGQVLAVRS